MSAAAHNVLTVVEAAKRLGCGDATLWRWIRNGAPVARRGRRGRGAVTTLVDLEALQAWRARTGSQTAPAPSSGDSTPLRELVAALPDLVTIAAEETHRAAAGPHKRAVAGELSAMGVRLLGAISDRLDGAVPLTMTEGLKRLRQISHL